LGVFGLFRIAHFCATSVMTTRSVNSSARLQSKGAENLMARGSKGGRSKSNNDEADVYDIKHEFNIEDEQNKNNNLAEALLHGRMSYGRGH
nr:cellulose synthase A catalytic subunit 7 [UDP-forming]-like [Tanacetum cinerariifolium]